MGPRLRNLGKKRGETMLYCAKCHGVCEDATAKCPNCKSSKLRPVTGDDFVLLHRVDQYTAQRLEPLFQEHGVAYRLEPFDGGRISYLYDSDVLPTDRMVLARWGDYPTAQGLARQLAQDIERERAAESGEEVFEDMPLKKRVMVQILSVAAFLVLIALVVFGADAVANWVKGLFQ